MRKLILALMLLGSIGMLAAPLASAQQAEQKTPMRGPQAKHGHHGLSSERQSMANLEPGLRLHRLLELQ
jgi:hypothetical protein